MVTSAAWLIIVPDLLCELFNSIHSQCDLVGAREAGSTLADRAV